MVGGLTLPRTMAIVWVFFGAHVPHVVKSECTQQQVSLFPDGWPAVLDSGVYWFGLNDEHEKAIGQKSMLFDPAKPTIIFVHGWTGYGGVAGVSKCRRWTSACTICEDKRLLAPPWLEKGWNYGIFYWDQFADERCLSDAELKIWMNPSRPQGLAWNSYNATSKKLARMHYDNSVASMGHLCAETLRFALRDFTGSDLRLAGHSIGAQLAAACANVLHKERSYPSAVLPTRLVLLDPVFTGAFQHWSIGLREVAGPLQSLLFHCGIPYNGSEDYSKVAPTSMLQAINFLWEQGVATELYKGSPLSLGRVLIFDRPFKELETLAAFVVQNVDGYCRVGTDYGQVSLECSHSSLVPLYMWRMADRQPEVNGGGSIGNCTLPGPACSDDQIRAFIRRNNGLISTTGARLVWHQNGGQGTLSTDDDSYRVVSEIVPTHTVLPAIQMSKLNSHPEVTEAPPVSQLGSESPQILVTTALLCILLCICGGCCCALFIGYFCMDQHPKEDVRSVSCCRVAEDCEHIEVTTGCDRDDYDETENVDKLVDDVYIKSYHEDYKLPLSPLSRPRSHDRLIE